MLIVVPFKRVPEGATDEQRRAMYEDWCAEFRLANPRYFNSDGTSKKWWQVLLGIGT